MTIDYDGVVNQLQSIVREALEDTRQIKDETETHVSKLEDVVNELSTVESNFLDYEESLDNLHETLVTLDGQREEAEGLGVQL